ncbi:MAG TPA: MATE family efflux transporter, partial [Polyangiales bacterium]|nr:MATE family efflux transporter [Polyangiales bacterium]
MLGSTDTKPGAGEARALWALALPVMVTQLLQMAMGVVDMVMLGHAGVQPMAAAVLANSYAFPSVMAGVGVVLGIDPLIAQAHGAGDGEGIALALQRGIVVALGVSVPIMALWYYAAPLLGLLGQPPELRDGAAEYLHMQVWSVPLFLLFMTLRQYLQGRGIVRPALLVLVAANVINALLDWALIFGHFGVPALGLRGAGIAAGLSRLADLLLLLAFIAVARLHEGAWRPWSRRTFELARLRELLRLGLPIGVQWGFEVLAFGLVAVMAGWLNPRAVSAHAICLNVASVTFMLPLGLAIGAATRVGNTIGEGNPEAARRTARLALAMTGGVMSCCALSIAASHRVLPAAFSEDPGVIAVAAGLLPIAAMFQIFDGTQVVCGGILRGMGRTRAPAVGHFVGYYVLGLPVGYWLAFHAGWGVRGLWWGLLVGLVTVASLLL